MSTDNNILAESRESSLNKLSLDELKQLVKEQKLQLKKLASGGFMAAKLHNELAEIPAEARDNDEITDGYQLKFVGKDYAKFQAGLKTETVITPDFEHNSKEENKNSENIFITGDNLDALKHLENAYSGKVDMIYIDPPYNTGSDGFVYADNFKFSDEDLREKLGLSESEVARVRALSGKSSHSAWLIFMLPRLMIAKRLLSNTGVIFISIDDNEQANLKMLCDEIFTERNFVADFIWIKKEKTSGVPPVNLILPNKEHILCYQKKEPIIFKGATRSLKSYKQDENGRWWRTMPIQATGNQDSRFDIVNPETGDVFSGNWAFSKDTIEKMISEGKIRFPRNKSGLPSQIVYADELTNGVPIFENLGLFDSEVATKTIIKLLDNRKLFDFPKPVSLIKFLIEQASRRNSLILDFFAGSATTADAVMQLNAEDGGNRKFILVQLPETVAKGSEAEKAGYKTIDQISRERIIRAAAKIGDKSGFKHFKLTTPEDENSLLKMEEFNPDEIVAFPEDMTTIFDGGEQAILQTWLVDDGFEFNQTPEIIEFAGYKAHYIENRLYLISTGWNSDATRELLNKIGKNELAVNSIILFPYSFSFNELNELKVNLRTAFEKANLIEVVERY